VGQPEWRRLSLCFVLLVVVGNTIGQIRWSSFKFSMMRECFFLPRGSLGVSLHKTKLLISILSEAYLGGFEPYLGMKVDKCAVVRWLSWASFVR
jgi:hypothetical protein